MAANSNRTLTPIPRSTAIDIIDTTKGAVHMVLGGGGTSLPSNELFFDPPQCRVIVSVGPPDPATGKRLPVYVREVGGAQRRAYGFAAFTVDPGSQPGGETTIKVAYYDVIGPDGRLSPRDFHPPPPATRLRGRCEIGAMSCPLCPSFSMGYRADRR